MRILLSWTPVSPRSERLKGVHCAWEGSLVYQLRPIGQEKREEIATHKYEGLTSFQRTFPHSRRNCGDAAVYGIINVLSAIWRSEKDQKGPGKEIISGDVCCTVADST